MYYVLGVALPLKETQQAGVHFPDKRLTFGTLKLQLNR